MREELLHFSVELGSQCLVMRQNEGRASDVSDDIGNGECLTATGDTEQCLCSHSLTNTISQLLYCLWLVTRRHIF